MRQEQISFGPAQNVLHYKGPLDMTLLTFCHISGPEWIAMLCIVTSPRYMPRTLFRRVCPDRHKKIPIKIYICDTMNISAPLFFYNSFFSSNLYIRCILQSSCFVWGRIWFVCYSKAQRHPWTRMLLAKAIQILNVLTHDSVVFRMSPCSFYARSSMIDDIDFDQSLIFIWPNVNSSVRSRLSQKFAAHAASRIM